MLTLKYLSPEVTSWPIAAIAQKLTVQGCIGCDSIDTCVNLTDSESNPTRLPLDHLGGHVGCMWCTLASDHKSATLKFFK